MLLDNQYRLHFPGHTRQQINDIAGGKSPGAREHNQANLLAPLREVHTTHHHKEHGFTLGERARLI